MQAQKFTLVSHLLCPYVQRAAIVLTEKGVAFERINIDLAHKPDWFLKLSPLGKTPVLLVDGQAIFESGVICEYLDEIALPRLHPLGALQRAQHRGWMEFGSSVLATVGALYNAPDEKTLAVRAANLRGKFEQVEAALEAECGGAYFSGPDFRMVDAVFGPVFRYFDVFESIDGFNDFGIFAALPKVNAWRHALAQRASVRSAASADYPELLRTFLLQRGSALSARMAVVSG